MKLRVKNWRLAILALLGFILFLKLGFWQLHRAHTKELQLQTFAARSFLPYLDATDVTTAKKHLRYRLAKFVGYFDSEHTLLLDNTIYKSKVGYEVYTPFQLTSGELILVDRGFVDHHGRRDQFPIVTTTDQPHTITGLLDMPPRYFALGSMIDAPIAWPLRVQYINLTELNKVNTFASRTFLPFILKLKESDPAAFTMEWQIVAMPPERHLGYAVQWFALAFTLLILFVLLNLKRTR